MKVPGNRNPLLRITLSFLTGILIYEIPGFQINLWPLFILLAVLIVLATICVSNIGFFRNISLASGLIFAMAYTTLGVLTARIRDPHSSIVSLEKTMDQVSYYQATVVSNREMSGDNARYIVKMDQVKTSDSWVKAGYKCLLYLRNDTLKDVKPGMQIIVKGQPKTIPSPKNPGEFDYKKYLSRKGIHLRHFIDTKALTQLPAARSSGWMLFTVLQGQLGSMLQAGMPEKEHWGVVSAMLLGDKKGIPDDIRTAYAHAGASHILAVSGLHVGIIYMIVLLAFGWMRQRTALRLLFYLLSLAAIWFFTAITGFTPSVSRAAIMISIIILGQATRSKPLVINTLAAAALLLLLLDPGLVFDVGFQLSFGAVMGIALFYNPIYDLLQFHHYLPDYAWKITSVSMAAQIPIAPLIIYYFHQIPLLFPITGIIVIPAAGLIIFLAIGFLLTGIIAPSFSWVGIVLGGTVKALNTVILYIESIPFSYLNDLYISPLETVLLIVFMLLSAFVFLYKKQSLLKMAFASGLLLLLSGYARHASVAHQKKLIVYAINRNAVAIDLIKGNNFYAFCAPGGADCNNLDYYRAGARLKYGLKYQERVTQNILIGKNFDLLAFMGKKILVVRKSSGIPEYLCGVGLDMIIVGPYVNPCDLNPLLFSPETFLVFNSENLHRKSNCEPQDIFPNGNLHDVANKAFVIEM